jgi:hypothetical protein
VVVTVGETVMEVVVAPPVQDNVPVQPVAVMMAFSPPQMDVLLALTVKTGAGKTVTETAEELSLVQLLIVQATL